MTPPEARRRLQEIADTLVQALEGKGAIPWREGAKLHTLALEAKDLLPQAFGPLDALKEVVDGMGGKVTVGTVTVTIPNQTSGQVGLLLAAAERWGFGVTLGTESWEQPEGDGPETARYTVTAIIQGDMETRDA